MPLERTALALSLILFLSLASSITVTTQAATGTESETLFADDFDGEQVNTEKWAVQPHVNESGYVAYGGQIRVNESNLFLSSDGTSFPSIITVANPFPANGNFTLEFDFTYTRITPRGSGLWVSSGPLQVDGINPFADILQVWSDSHGLWVDLLQEVVFFSSSSLSTHLFDLEYCGGVYTIKMDGTTIASVPSLLRPNLIGLGHPLASYLPFASAGAWSAFKIDKIQLLSSLAQDGNETYPTTNDVNNATVLETSGTTLFNVESNSTLSYLAFNSTAKEISFSVSGVSGTTGYMKLLVSKSLVENQSDLKLYMDGNQVVFNLTAVDHAWLLYFNYTHSKHDVLVTARVLQQEIIEPSFPLWIILPAAIGAASVAVFLVKKKKHKPCR
jgi:hypothetical protein